MNDNGSNVIDLSTATQATAVIVPDGLRDLLLLGFNPDGTLYFNSESLDLGKVALLLALAQRRMTAFHDAETGDVADED